MIIIGNGGGGVEEKTGILTVLYSLGKSWAGDEGAGVIFVDK